MPELESGYTPENAVEIDDAADWKRLTEICQDLFPDLDEETVTYLAGLGVDMSFTTNSEGAQVAAPQERHVESLAEAIEELMALATDRDVEDELTNRLLEAGILE